VPDIVVFVQRNCTNWERKKTALTD